MALYQGLMLSCTCTALSADRAGVTRPVNVKRLERLFQRGGWRDIRGAEVPRVLARVITSLRF